jgi:chromosome segregation ATPase
MYTVNFWILILMMFLFTSFPAFSSDKASALAPWVELENKITELNARINSKNRNLQELIQSKNQMPNNSPQLRTVVKDLIREHKELQALVDDYQKKVTMLKYRFPERNARDNRTYQRIEVRSLEEMEQALGVDGKLNRNLQRMRGQFRQQAEAPMPEKNKAERKPAASEAQEPSIENAGSIILQK